MNKDAMKLIRRLEKAGCKVTQGRGGHFRIQSPDPEIPIVFLPATPSCSRTNKNNEMLLKRLGIEC